MKTVDFPTLLERIYCGLMGSFVTLLLLSQFGKDDYSREAGFVLLALTPFAIFDIVPWRKRISDGTSFSIHQIISLSAFLIFSSMFILKHSFGVEAVGHWTFLPLIVFFFANWFANRESEALRS